MNKLYLVRALCVIFSLSFVGCKNQNLHSRIESEDIPKEIAEAEDVAPVAIPANNIAPVSPLVVPPPPPLIPLPAALTLMEIIFPHIFMPL